MNCKNCGEFNDVNAKVCSKCGSSLEAVNNSNANNPVNGFQNNVNVTNNPVGEVQNNVSSKNKNTSGSGFGKDLISFFLGCLLKPSKTFIKSEDKLDNTKNSFILFGIIAGVLTLVSIISTIINIVRVKNYFSNKIDWKWDYLEHIKWSDLIFKSLAMYAILIIALAGIFYIASLIMKKQIKFNKTLSITSISFLPVAAGMLAATILGIIWSDLYLILYVLGLIYFMFTFITLISDYFELEGDIKIYTYTACFTIYAILIYYISTSNLVSGAASIF